MTSMIKTLKCQLRADFEAAETIPAAKTIAEDFKAEFNSGGKYSSLVDIRNLVVCLTGKQPVDSCTVPDAVVTEMMVNAGLQADIKGVKKKLEGVDGFAAKAHQLDNQCMAQGAGKGAGSSK